ncbi:MAG TPA: DUF6644 family protein [Vicinamibacteria bacterium]|jgi:hypothetical protein
MSLLPFCRWLAETRWSVALHESLWVYPLVESTHVWSLALFVGFTVLLDLRLVGAAMRSVPTSEVARRLFPWMIAGFAIMVVTGLLLFYAIPVRTYQSVFFRLKLILLALAAINVFVFHSGIWRQVADWDRDSRPPRAARVAGALSLLLWVGVIFCGRMIAYNWFDCDRQPQPAIVNWAAGCVLESG